MRTLLFAVLLAAPLPLHAQKESAADVVARVQRYYEATKDLHARFDQVNESQVGRVRKASGELWLKKPGRMRWDYEKPEKQRMVSDGQTLWVYQPEDEQAFKQDLRGSTLPVSVTFLVGQGKLADEFEVSIVHPAGVGAAGDVVLKLVPKVGTAAYRYLLFVVDPKSGLVRETLVYDQQGGSNHLTFSQVETNRGVDDARFRFTPPPGTRVIKP
jgi:outer membrane lipoprotein carrier protein